VARRFRSGSVHKLDQKGRVSVPASFRRVIEEGDPDWISGKQPTFVLIHGFPGRPRLEGYTIKGIEELDEMVSSLNRFSRQRHAMELLLNNNSTYMQIDDNGRTILNSQQRDFASLESDVQFAGMGEHFQVWSPAEFQHNQADLSATIEEAGGEDALENLFASIPGSGGMA
jgi:MraZ protein